MQHIMGWDRLGRKGQLCEILRGKGNLVQIRFQDGYTAVVDRRALRRMNDAERKKLDVAVDKSTLTATHLPCTGE
jgi:hypothetical protein